MSRWRAADRLAGELGERLTRDALDELQELGWVVLHDLPAGKGRTANIDHVAVGPGGVWVVETKHYAGELVFSPAKYRGGGDALKIGDTDRTNTLWRSAVVPAMTIREIASLQPIRASVRAAVVLHTDPELEETRAVGRYGGVLVGGARAIVDAIAASQLSPHGQKALGRETLGRRAVEELAKIIDRELPNTEPPASKRERWTPKFCHKCGAEQLHEKPGAQKRSKRRKATSEGGDTGEIEKPPPVDSTPTDDGLTITAELREPVAVNGTPTIARRRERPAVARVFAIARRFGKRRNADHRDERGRTNLPLAIESD